MYKNDNMRKYLKSNPLMQTTSNTLAENIEMSKGQVIQRIYEHTLIHEAREPHAILITVALKKALEMLSAPDVGTTWTRTSEKLPTKEDATIDGCVMWLQWNSEYNRWSDTPFLSEWDGVPMGEYWYSLPKLPENLKEDEQ